MNRSLLLNGLILGTLLCTGTITARAVDADVQSGIAAAAPRETRAQAVHSTWRDRTDIAVGVQTGSSSEGHESLFPTDDHNQFYRQKKDYGNLTKAYVETLQPITHYDENAKSVVFVQGRIGRSGEKIRSYGLRGYFLPEKVTTPVGLSFKAINVDEDSSKTLGNTWGIVDLVHMNMPI